MFIGRQLQRQHISELDMAISLSLCFPKQNRLKRTVLLSRIKPGGEWNILLLTFETWKLRASHRNQQRFQPLLIYYQEGSTSTAGNESQQISHLHVALLPPYEEDNGVGLQ